ncbi:MAG: FAD-binding protein [Candidatus Peribacteraceae bacterium]|nr:FAD-binding protein [Candidatus Peribacteraceae bacterium]
MEIQSLVPVGSKTTMRIGGQARAYAELATKEDVEQAVAYSTESGLPLVMLGGGSNTVFADGVIEALVCRIKNAETKIEGNAVTVNAGVTLGSLINELAEKDLDLSALTGIPGTIGGAIIGNAGQGFGGTWIDSYVRSVTVFMEGRWQTLSPMACRFRYRESGFKEIAGALVVWEAQLEVPSRPGAEVKAEVERLLQKRIETQPHLKTAGSAFKSLPDGTPAWKLIEAAGLRGTKVGDLEISTKHCNFFTNAGKATFDDVLKMTALIREKVPRIEGIEMRLYGNDGQIVKQH